ncbi:hypothetical protein IWW50_002037 [Coemansia erecta]|nr:hypothetical protein GGF43_003064 [Coemansia sp. RSA 2618]KAJ2827132.1 hypothetical protein IWW50_002037 [Coemansia erecta]
MAESFVKPPAELIITLPYQVSLAAVIVNPRVRMNVAKHVSLFVMSDRGVKWEYVGKMMWMDEGSGRLQGMCNKELNPAQINSARRDGEPAVETWQPIEKAPESLHFVRKIKVRLAAMHNSVALGIGGVEIWAQPSQRLPWRQREQAWIHTRQHLPKPEHVAKSVHENKPHATNAECPPEFIDSITHNIMSDPVILPSNKRCERSTITRHLAAHATDPFTGLPLDSSQIRPDLSLQLRIRAWRESQ